MNSHFSFPQKGAVQAMFKRVMGNHGVDILNLAACAIPVYKTKPKTWGDIPDMTGQYIWSFRLADSMVK